MDNVPPRTSPLQENRSGLAEKAKLWQISHYEEGAHMFGFGPIVNSAAVSAFLISGQAAAAAPSVQIHASFDLVLDCERPFQVQNRPVHADLALTLNKDKSASADLGLTGTMFPATIHFDTGLGGRPKPAPGGTSILRVQSGNRVQGIWDLPNNQLIIDITTRGSSCAAALRIHKKNGATEYSMFDGSIMYYCNRQQVTTSSCEIK